MTALSPTQQAIVRRVAAGETNQTIAAGLGLAPVTVKNHVTRIRRAFGLPGGYGTGAHDQRRFVAVCREWAAAQDPGQVAATVALSGPAATREQRVAALRRRIDRAAVRAGGSERLARAILAWAEAVEQRAQQEQVA